MEIFLKGRNNQYEANGIWEDGTVIVQKGSKISNRLCATASRLVRKSREKVNSDGILMQDIRFPSASSAAQFVKGDNTNGLKTWRLSNGDPLSTLGVGNKRRPKRIK